MSKENPLLTMIREVCALGRSQLERPHTATGDLDAAHQLVDGLQALDPDGEPSDISLSVELLKPRAPYFDQLVLDAVAARIPQIVNLGAGFDDRAFRFSAPGVKFFELDLPHVIAEKERRIAAMSVDTSGLALIPLDFEVDDCAEALVRAGHEADRPTLFLAEHLFLFLQPDAVNRLIASVTLQAAAGSLIAITAEVHPAGLDPSLVVATVDEEMFGGAGPLRTIDSRESWLARFEMAGWKVRDPAMAFNVNHFELAVRGETVQIQTQFFTAAR